MTTKLWIDFETYSEVPIKLGTHAYAEGAEILLWAYALDDEPAEVWDCTLGDQAPGELLAALADPTVEVWAHNSGFDRTVLRHVMPTLCPPIERWRDTMIQATSHSLPGALGEVARILGLPEDQQKDKDGKRLIRKFCMPQPKGRKVARFTRDTDPADWERFVRYARDDIVAMRAVHKKLPKWNYPGSAELDLWHLDQKINDRGVAVDLDLVRGAIHAVGVAQKELAERTVEMTDGALQSTTQRNAMLEHLAEQYGFHLADLTGSTLERKLEDPTLDPAVRALLEVRLQASTTSTSKYKALLGATSRDGRVRGLLQFNGASRTGRWAGRVFQPQNLPRPVLKDRQIEDGIEHIKAGTVDLAFDTDYTMKLASSAIRGCLVVPTGRKMPIADLSNIEGRALAWLAGEQWKLDAFAAFDRGDGHDLYALSYAKSFGITPEEVMHNKKHGDGSMRQIGKVQELACLAGNTPVVTFKGVKPLQSITTGDLLWDGKQWVTHQGLIAKGTRPVLSVAGIEVTPDHLIKTGRTWTQAQQLATCENTLSQALATGSENLPSWVSSARFGEPVTTTWSKSSAPAALNHIWCSITTFAKERARAVVRALARPLGTGVKATPGMPMFAQMTTIAADCWTAFLPLSTGAITQTTVGSTTTGAEASACTRPGGKTDGVFWPTLSRWVGGTTQSSTWIGLMSKKGTSLAICGSSPAARTATTSAPSAKCSSESATLKPVFDILNSGPDNCFTVLSEHGPLIVHNCGYEGGAGAFATFASAYGIDLDDMAVGVLDRADPEIEAEARHMYAWFKQKDMPTYGMREDTFVACDIIKRGWRRAHGAISTWWPELEQGFRDALAHPGYEFAVRSVVIDRPTTKSGKPTQWVRIKLPSGRYLCYPAARIAYRTVKCDSCGGLGCPVCNDTGRKRDDSDTKGQIAYRGMNQYTRKWCELKSYSGKLAENITQAFSRDVLAYNMPAIEADGYEIILSVHDELLTETPDTDEYSSDALTTHMSTVPPWATGLPLAAAGFETYRYKKD